MTLRIKYYSRDTIPDLVLSLRAAELDHALAVLHSIHWPAGTGIAVIVGADGRRLHTERRRDDPAIWAELLGVPAPLQDDESP